MDTLAHSTREEIEAALARAGASPAERGVVEMIVARPRENERTVLERGRLDVALGLEGDYWRSSAPASRNDQLTLVNARVIGAVAGAREHWPLAGDQLYVDFDLSLDNAPPGTRLAVGAAIVEVSELPHTGCTKFRDRFGRDALRLVNSTTGRQRCMRGINAFVVRAGEIAVGDAISKA